MISYLIDAKIGEGKKRRKEREAEEEEERNTERVVKGKIAK